jgi:hypothetical protein
LSSCQACKTVVGPGFVYVVRHHRYNQAA